MANLKTWIKAARPRTVLLSLSGVLMGGFLAIKEESCHPLVILFAALTAIMLQILSNLANDYGDFKKGVDGPQRIGPQREMQRGAIGEQEMRRGMFLVAALCLMSGAILIFGVSRLTWEELGIFAMLGIGAVLAALLYTLGKRPYGYRGLGDLFCFLFFGWAATAGTYYLSTKNLDWAVLLPASAMGFMSNAVLNINNMRDYESDLASGKRSLVVKIGLKNAFIYHVALIASGFICLSAFLLLKRAPFYAHLFWLTSPLFIKDLIAMKKGLEAHHFDAFLPRQVKFTALLVVVFGVIFALA